MSIHHRIAFNTDENSLRLICDGLREQHKKQPPEIKKLIDSIIDYYETIIRCMPGNVYWMDEDLRALGCNQNVLDTFNLKSQKEFYDISFEAMAKLGHWSQNQGLSFKEDSLEVLRTGIPKINIEEPPIIGPDGRLTRFLTSRAPLFNNRNQVIGFVGISVDITEKKAIEETLLETKMQLEKASEAKTEFIANISHDLRTALTGILGLSQSLEKKLKDDENRSDAKLLSESAHQMLGIINNIIEVIEIESDKGEIKASRFSLKQIVDNNLKLFAPAVRDKGLDLKFFMDKEVPEFLIGNQFYFDRILLNLIGNAIKFTHLGFVALEVSLLKKTKEDIVLQVVVRDSGIGIPEEKFSTIFEYFSRLSPAFKGRYKGLGIGLYTVKQYLEKMSGTIKVESKLGEGSQFTIVVPFRLPTPEEEANREEPIIETYLPTKQHSGKVLLVEDHPLAARMAAEIIKSTGCHVVTVSSGEDALRQVEKEAYDLIFVDIGLPGIDGFEVAKNIRMNPKETISSIPIIALTAHMTKNQVSSCKAAGMQEMLTKPITPTLVDYVFEKFVLAVNADLKK